MSNRVKGKVALVTAAGQGIGRAIAEALIAEGAKVIATDVAEDKVKEATKGESFHVRGRVIAVRSTGGLSFLRLRDRTGERGGVGIPTAVDITDMADAPRPEPRHHQHLAAVDSVLDALHTGGNGIHHVADARAVSRQVDRDLLALQIESQPR